MAEPALHETTRSAVARYLQRPSQALCLIGSPGAGKGFLAAYIAGQALENPGEDAVHTITPVDGGIGIEQIRELHRFLRLKKPGRSALRRAVIIEDAGTMSDEAQNALLKMLEEPPADTIFILAADNAASLLPTIYSRVQKLHVLPLSLEEAKVAFQAPASELTKAFHLSGGYAGLLYALLNDPEHKLVAAVEQAKKIMQATAFERLAMIDALAKQKDSLPALLYALQRLLGAVMAQAKDKARLARLVASSRALYEAEQDLGRNANVKLLLTDLFLRI